MTVVDAQVGEAGVSGRVQEGVLAPFLLIVDNRPFWLTERPRRLAIEHGRLV